MPHRSYASTANYRFGFNGKENDNEPKGLGNQQDYGMRVYDSRLGKFLSVDALTRNFPSLTPYQFSSNTPIGSVDLDGNEAKYYMSTHVFVHKGSSTEIVAEDYTVAEDKTKEGGFLVHGALYRSPGSLGTGMLITFYEQDSYVASNYITSSSLRELGTLYIPSPGDKGRGGLFFVSKSSGYTSTNGYLEGNDAIPIPIDLLISAVGGFPGEGGGEIEALNDIPKILKTDVKFAEKLEKLLSSVKFINETLKKPLEVEEAIKTLLEEQKENNKTYAPNSEICSSCGAKLPDSRGEDHDLDVYRNDREGKVKDTVRKNAQTGKKEIIPTKKGKK